MTEKDTVNGISKNSLINRAKIREKNFRVFGVFRG